MDDRRQKLSIAAKKRRRAPKGSPHAGEFQSGKLHAAFVHTAAISGAFDNLPMKRKPGASKPTSVSAGLNAKARAGRVDQKASEQYEKLAQAYGRGRARGRKEGADSDKLVKKAKERVEASEKEIRERVDPLVEQLAETVQPGKTKSYTIPEHPKERATRHRRFESGVNKDWEAFTTRYERYRDQNRRDGLGTQVSTRRAVERAYRETDLESNGRFGASWNLTDVRENLQKQHPQQSGLYTGMNPEDETSYRQQNQDVHDSESKDRRQKRGMYPGSSPAAGPIKYREGKYDTPAVAKSKMHHEDVSWLEQETNKPNSPFYNAQGLGHDPGSYRRMKTFTDLLQQGYGVDEAYGFIKGGGGNVYKGRRAATSKSASKEDQRAQQAKETIENKVTPKARGRKPGQKYSSTAPTHESMSLSIRAPNVDKISELRQKFPDWSESDLIKFQTDQARAVDEYILSQNSRWAHESRRQQYLGRKVGDTGADKGRVVFFTTNAGAPTASVPANSLLGQYVIKKRKKMVVDDKLAQRYEVKGEFPAAVRDQHLIEISTGLRIGAEGRYGAFHNTGWRKGTKRSKGFGKQIPVGAQVLRDPTGRPVYDDKGNIRYTEGYTRPFNVGTDRDLGLRVFLG